MAASAALAGAPEYDAFSEPDGFIATGEQELAAWAMLRDPEQLEAVHADAVKGNLRAVHVLQQLEATLAASGEALAERTAQPGCLVPAYRELSKQCVPGWTFVSFLREDRPAGARLRKLIFGAFAVRARERGLENRLILSAANGLLSIALATAVLRQAEAAASATAALDRTTTGFIDDVTVTSHGKVIGRGTVDVRATVEAIRSGRLAPRDIFRNDQGLLPKKAAGYYQEFVHPTPGSSGVGPQRIIRGQAGELYYTPDHYRTFIRLDQ